MAVQLAWAPQSFSGMVGLKLGDTDGLADGLVEGLKLGDTDGDADGDVDGDADGDAEGDRLGLAEGLKLGDTDGLADGERLGLVLGDRDGDALGLPVGASVLSQQILYSPSSAGQHCWPATNAYSESKHRGLAPQSRRSLSAEALFTEANARSAARRAARRNGRRMCRRMCRAVGRGEAGFYRVFFYCLSPCAFSFSPRDHGPVSYICRGRAGRAPTPR
jgi:hypothetical protein